MKTPLYHPSRRCLKCSQVKCRMEQRLCDKCNLENSHLGILTERKPIPDFEGGLVNKKIFGNDA